MNKLLLAVLFMPILQVYSQGLPVSETGKVIYTEVVNSSVDKAQLFIRAKSWIARRFVSANDVIQMEDQDAGIIIGKGVAVLPIETSFNGQDFVSEIDCYFLLKLDFKNLKYRYQITDITYKPRAATLTGPMPEFPVEDLLLSVDQQVEKRLQHMGFSDRKIEKIAAQSRESAVVLNNEYIEETNKSMHSLIDGLKKAMSRQGLQDDW